MSWSHSFFCLLSLYSTMRCAIIVVAFLAIAVNSAEIRIDPPSAQCQGEIDRVWLDVIFLVDSSSGMTQHGLRKADAFLESVMRQMTIGEDTYQESRVGIITYAAEAHVVRDLSRSDNSSSTLPYAGDDEANLFGAFTAAVNMFDNSTSVHRKKVIVIAASTYEEEGPHDAVQIAKQFKISGGSIVTIDYRVSHSGLSPLADLASNGFAFTNNDLEVANLFNSFLHVNCFCPFDRHGASSTTYGSPDGGCFDDENIQSDWMAASDLCHEEGGFLVKIENEQKQRTMDNVASSSPYWIGLRFNSAHDGFYWQDWSEMNFTRWASSQPDLSIGECAFSKGSHWYSAPCNGDKKGLADHVFFCEIQPCSANADCYHPVAPNVTEPAFPEVSTLRPEEPSTVLPIEVSTLKPEEPSTVLPIEVSTLKPEEPST
ncbi:clec-160, partial [Pristionchus pacificus]